LTPSGGGNLCEAKTSKLKEQIKRTKETGSPLRRRASLTSASISRLDFCATPSAPSRNTGMTSSAPSTGCSAAPDFTQRLMRDAMAPPERETFVRSYNVSRTTIFRLREG
jgi:hypothetical protein